MSDDVFTHMQTVISLCDTLRANVCLLADTQLHFSASREVHHSSCLKVTGSPGDERVEDVFYIIPFNTESHFFFFFFFFCG